ncbi:MAG: outer membrane protein assembly factor [Leptospiraceae bacterium]|nr:outer membrane protein assembly factor [Leptospiraceae bacterium]
MKKGRKIFIFCLMVVTSIGLIAQPATERKPVSGLPFEVSESKRLNVKDVEKKKEGWYPTGLPLVNSDPNTGIGYGARVLLFNNKSKSDPFFEYTPYRTRIFAQYFNTTKNYQYHWISLDSPYIADSKWRVRADAIYESNPVAMYFGRGKEAMQTLSYHPMNDYSQPLNTNTRFGATEEALAYTRPANPNEIQYHENPQLNSVISQSLPLRPTQVTDKKYYRYDNKTPQFLASAEHSFFGGTVRTVGGVRFAKNIINFYDGEIYNSPSSLTNKSMFIGETPVVQGKTKLKEDCEAKKIRGCEGGYVNQLRIGLVYDTRDFEPDPNKGVFAEITHDRTMKAMGSNYEYNKTWAQGRIFISPAPRTFEKLVIAARAAVGRTSGDAPFYEYRNFWGTEGTVSGLGGLRTLRGYKQDRFVGPVVGFYNLELRWKFYEVPGFAFNLVPFVDAGRVWDKTSEMGLKGYKYSKGIGLRIAWNQATIIMIDYARSREDSQLFVNFNHIF